MDISYQYREERSVYRPIDRVFAARRVLCEKDLTTDEYQALTQIYGWMQSLLELDQRRTREVNDLAGLAMLNRKISIIFAIKRIEKLDRQYQDLEAKILTFESDPRLERILQVGDEYLRQHIFDFAQELNRKYTRHKQDSQISMIRQRFL